VIAPVLSGTIFLVVAATATVAAVLRRQSLFDSPIYLALYSYVLFVGAGPLFGELIQPMAIIVRNPFEPTLRTLLLSWLGLMALGWGYRSRIQTENRRSVSKILLPRRGKQDAAALLLGGIAWTLIGVAGAAAYLWSVGGLNYLLETAYGTRDNPSLYAGFYNMLRPGLFLIAAWALIEKKKSAAVWVGLFVYGCFDLLWFGPLSGSRNQIITVVLTLACIAKYIPGSTDGTSASTLLGHRWLIGVGLALALAWGGARTYSIEDLSSASGADVRANSVVMAAETLYAPFQGFVGVTSMTPGDIPYQWGRTLFDSVTVFVPRALWPSKSGSVGDWLAQTFYGTDITFNIVLTWPGELYFNFGWLGLVVGMYWTGRACARMARLRPGEDEVLDVWRGLMAAVWFPLPFIWIWGGSNTAVWHILFNVLPIYLVYKIAPLFDGSSGSGGIKPSLGEPAH